MTVRIFLASAAEIDSRKAIQPKFSRLQVAMLAGKYQRGRNALRMQGIGHGLQFDRFRPGADDQPYIPDTQPSP